MNSIVVIPVYKEQPTPDELFSLRRCLRILGRHDLCLVCPPSLPLAAYEEEFRRTGVPCRAEHFDATYFESQRGYNRLMLSRTFYERFAAWDYLLICQLDAYVFSDRLDEWCAKGYDYVGAPWCDLRGRIDPHNCGNGGFSLRRVQAFLSVFDYTGTVLTLRGLWKFHRYRGPLHRTPLVLKGLLGRGNRLEDYLRDDRLNEDLFFACLSHRRRDPFRIPSSEVAMHFAFEEHPALLYRRTGGKLPFGCHAWRRWEYETFYRPLFHRIEEKESSLPSPTP